MKEITERTLKAVGYAIIDEDIVSDAVFLKHVYDVSTLDKRGEEDLDALLVARDVLAVLSVVRTLCQTFDNERATEETRIRLRSIRNNASILIFRLVATATDEISVQLRAYNASKDMLKLVYDDCVYLTTTLCDIHDVPVEALPGYLTMKGTLISLEYRIDMEIVGLELQLTISGDGATRTMSSIATSLPDEIGVDEPDGAAALPREFEE